MRERVDVPVVMAASVATSLFFVKSLLEVQIFATKACLVCTSSLSFAA